MSKAVSRFEGAHGIRLLHRSTHAMSLTDDGERLLEDAREVLQGIERLETNLAGAKQGGGGRVRISAPGAFGRTCMMPVLHTLRRAHPEIDIELFCENTMVDLADSGVDLALRAGRLKGTPGHLTRTLFTFPWIACASAEYLERRGVPSHPAELPRHDQVSFLNAATGRLHNWEFAAPGAHGIDDSYRHRPDAKLVLNDGTAAWNMITAGFGIGWAPAWLGMDDLRSGRVVEVLKAWRTTETPLSIVRLDRKLTPKRIKIVIEHLAAASSGWTEIAFQRHRPGAE